MGKGRKERGKKERAMTEEREPTRSPINLLR